MENKQDRYSGIYLGLFVAALIWGIHLAGLFILPDGVVYDLFTRLTPEKHRASDTIMILEVDGDTQQNIEWLSLLNILDLSGAGQVLFSFVPEQAPAAFFSKAKEMENVFFGVPASVIEPTRKDQETIRDQQIGIIKLPESQFGVYRRYPSHVTTAGKTYPTLEFKAAQARLNTPLVVENPFLVNFINRTNNLPKINLDRILAGKIVPQLLKGRTVLIGFSIKDERPGMHTPIYPYNRELSFLEYRGQVLDTLISQKVIQRVNPWTTLVCIVLVAMMGIVSFQFFNLQMSIGLTFFYAAATSFIAWVFAYYLFVWIPVVEMMFAQFALLFILVFWQLQIREKSAKRTLLKESLKLYTKMFPGNFLDSPEYWSQLINMVDQVVTARRHILLERVENDHRVREMVALHCGIDDIEEKRRDYHRTPYLTAIKEGNRIKVKSFFKKKYKDEDQFLVPLVFSGQVYGFWAFTLEKGETVDAESQLALIHTFAREIGEIFYRKRAWIAQKKKNQNIFLRLLKLEAGEDLQKTILQVLSTLGKRLSMLESVINCVETSTILYDSFGRVLQLNQRMSEFLESIHVKPYELTMLDLAVNLTGKSQEQARKMLKHLIINRESLHIPVTMDKLNKSFLLNVSPIFQEDSTDIQLDIYPFQLYGILFEMQDISGLKVLSNIKEEFIEHINVRLRQDLASVTMACTMLEKENLSKTNLQQITALLTGKKNSMIEFVDSLNGFLEKDIFSYPIDLYPINPVDVLVPVLAEFDETVQEGNITIEMKNQGFMGLMLAGPSDVKAIFRSVLVILIKDAVENSKIMVEIKETADQISYDFSNTGFGRPNEEFNQYLSSTANAPSEEFEHLINAIQTMEKWGGRLTAGSELGTGTWFCLKFRRMI